MASPEGIVAVGGDLSPQRLLNAYSSGIFPWFSEGEPILWWSPSPRLVLFPEELHVSRSMRKFFRRNPSNWAWSMDRDFEGVVSGCLKPGKGRESTWITDEMFEAYCQLHELGFAHSVEVWEGELLVGGFYGISLGGCFFGESMFTTKANASKFGFIHFVELLQELNFLMVDCQIPTNHLKSLGAREISREDYIKFLEKGLELPTLRGIWEI